MDVITKEQGGIIVGVTLIKVSDLKHSDSHISHILLDKYRQIPIPKRSTVTCMASTVTPPNPSSGKGWQVCSMELRSMKF